MPNDYFNPPNSIWPNGLKKDDEGYVVFYPLGTNKVNVPTSSSEWPKGDKFVSPFVYQDDKLVGFIDTKALTTDSQTTIYLPYEHIEADFSEIDKGQLQIHAPKATTKKASWKDSGVENIPEVQFKYKGCKTLDNVKTVDANYQTTDIVNGVWSEPLWDLEQGTNGNMFEGLFAICSQLTSFSSDLPSLTDGNYMFYGCSNLTTFTSDLSSLTDGEGMFNACTNLTSFSSDLPSLTGGKIMFRYCTNLTSFSFDLSSLTDGEGMFERCSSLTSFSSDLSSLTSGYGMFYMCSDLTSFTSNLSSLMYGDSMFYMCSDLTSFTSNLSSLMNGEFMFYKCKLDALSVKNIIDAINTYSGKLALGMGCNNTTEDTDLFAQEVGYTDMASLLAALQTKGWNVEAQYNGRPTTTYGLRRPSEDTLPVFVKLEEVEEHADYTSEDGSKKFRLVWFHETTGSTDEYTQYTSLEEAIEFLNIKPIEK